MLNIFLRPAAQGCPVVFWGRLLCALCLVLLPLTSARAASAADPRQCVLEAGKAVDAADVAAFERVVDMDAILEQALAVFVSRARQPEAARELPPMLAILFAQAAGKDGMGANVRSLLLSESRAFVRNGIASGAFAGRKPTGQGAQGLLAPLFADASTGRKTVRQVGQARPEGKAWLVPFVVHDEGNGHSYDIVGRITAGSEGLRLVALANMEALLERLGEEARSSGP